MSYTVGVVCDIGAGPEHGGRQRNEDNFLVCCDNQVMCDMGGERTVSSQPGEGLLLAVCDGMGGHADGHVASETAVKVLARLYQPGPPARPERVLMRYILETHRQLHAAALAEQRISLGDRGDSSPTPLMGTTLTTAWVLGYQCAWAHVGDSRLYHYRQGRLTQVSKDHTRNEFARRDGRSERPDGDSLAQNFIYGSRGLGDNAALRMDAGLDSGLIDLLPGDRLVLCTDGLCGTLGDTHIAGILRDHQEPGEASDQLRTLAVEAGSLDNVTVIVLRVDDVPYDPNHDTWNADDETTETDVKPIIRQ